MPFYFISFQPNVVKSSFACEFDLVLVQYERLKRSLNRSVPKNLIFCRVKLIYYFVTDILIIDNKR